jgi:hypothetical protein
MAEIAGINLHSGKGATVFVPQTPLVLAATSQDGDHHVMRVAVDAEPALQGVSGSGVLFQLPSEATEPRMDAHEEPLPRLTESDPMTPADGYPFQRNDRASPQHLPWSTRLQHEEPHSREQDCHEQHAGEE